MKPGHELDMKIGLLLGWWHEPDESMYKYWHHPDGHQAQLPAFSTEIEAAWKVVDHFNLFKNDFALFQCDWHDQPVETQWNVMENTGGWEFTDYVNGCSVPHVICLAALKRFS